MNSSELNMKPYSLTLPIRNITKVTLIILSVALLNNCAKTTNEVHYRKYPITFAQAKKVSREIYKLHPKTFYCSCEFNNDGVVDLSLKIILKEIIN